jgi:hypothetical protein
MTCRNVTTTLIVLGCLFLLAKRKTWGQSQLFRQGPKEGTLKPVVFWFVAFELALIISSCIPYIRYGWPTHFENYVAFAAPAAAGIIVGGGVFYDKGLNFDVAGKAYLVSLVFIFLGWLGFVCADHLGYKVPIWSLSLMVISSSFGLAGLNIKKDYANLPLGKVYFPMVMWIGITSTMLGLLSFIFDPATFFN